MVGIFVLEGTHDACVSFASMRAVPENILRRPSNFRFFAEIFDKPFPKHGPMLVCLRCESLGGFKRTAAIESTARRFSYRSGFDPKNLIWVNIQGRRRV